MAPSARLRTGVVVIAMIGAASPRPAAAAEAVAPRIVSVMRIVGFDPSVAANHGYRVVTLLDGRRASVPAAARKRNVEPMATVDGDCGYSYVVPPASYVLLWNGGVCYSGGPSDRKYIL